MPIDYTHQHISTDIMRVDTPHTPIDPNGGGGAISVTDGTTTVADVTTLSVPSGLLTDAGDGVAQLNLFASNGIGDDNGQAIEVGGGSADSEGTGAGGSAVLFAGDSGVGVSGPDSAIVGGYGDGGSVHPGEFRARGGGGTGDGGDVLANGGAAHSGDGQKGGDVKLVPGAGDGAGRHGLVFANLPTSDPHVVGALWADSGVVTVSAG